MSISLLKEMHAARQAAKPRKPDSFARHYPPSGPVGADGLTPKQRSILQFYRDHYRETGIPPTVREVMAAMGFSSPNAVVCHVRPLVRRGFLVNRSGKSSHGFMPVVPAGHCPCCGQRKDGNA